MKKRTKGIIIFLICLVLVVLVATMLSDNGAGEISYTSLVEDIKAGKVANIQITGDYVLKVRYNDSKIAEKNFPNKYDAFCYIPDRNVQQVYDMIEDCQGNTGWTSPKVSYDNPARRSLLYSLLLPILSVVLLGIVMYIIYRQSQGQNQQAMNFGKTKARVTQSVKVRFSDVAGAEEEKEELQEIVEFLKNPKKFVDIGARIPKGVLLVGPPGTGKTLFAKAVAGEANVPFFSISGSDFVEMFVGVGASRVRDLFDQAKHNMPCIVFIDEIDAVGRQRGTGLGGGHDEREQTLNQLLVQMDGFEKNDGIIVMAATNRADILDPALLRPGRFDRQVYVGLPDIRGREDILKIHVKNKPLAEDVDLKTVARGTSGFTGADLENLANEAALLAARRNEKFVTMQDFAEAEIKVIAGPEKKSRVVSEQERRLTAYHEAGHAIVMHALPTHEPVHQITIIPRGQAGGMTISLPEEDRSYQSRRYMEEQIVSLLGGRVAEALCLGDISTGASSDIRRASQIARRMVTVYGMSEKLGAISFESGQDEVFIGRTMAQAKPYSEQVASQIDEEVKAIIDNAYAQAEKILKRDRGQLDTVAEYLLAHETMDAQDFLAVFSDKTQE